MKRNPVETAIDKLGGPTQAIVKTGVAATTWWRWRQRGYIADTRVMLDVAALTGMDPDVLAKPRRDVA